MTTDLWERWVGEYQPGIYRTACLILRDPHAAEDVAQETFIRAYRAATDLESAQVRPWLQRIAINLSLNVIRSRKRERQAVERLPAEVAVDDLTERRATRSVVVDALKKLPDRLRVPIILRYYVDLPEKEIAKILRIRPGTVKSRLHEARALLAQDDQVKSSAV